MDTIKALQIVMAALSAALIREFYDSTKHQETTNMFIAEMLMSTLVGTIIGFIVQKYMQDIMFIMGITAASSMQGPESLNRIIKLLLKIKGLELEIEEEEEIRREQREEHTVIEIEEDEEHSEHRRR